MENAKTIFNNMNWLRAGVFVASFFFIFLGMRNPQLNHNHGPKQRPRAVIEKITKVSEEVSKNCVDAIDLNEPSFLDEPALAPVLSHILSSQIPPATVVSHLIARAPPAVS